MLEHMFGEKEAMQNQMGNIAQELQNQAAEKEGLSAKVNQLYAALTQKSYDKAGIDRLFTQVMNGKEDSEKQ